MAFKDDVDAESDDDDGAEDMDDYDEEDDDLDDYDDDDLAVAGDMELDDEEAERKRKQRKEKMRLKLNRRDTGSPLRRPSETDEEDWQSMGAESLRRASMAMTPSFPNLGPSAMSSGSTPTNSVAAHDPTGFYAMDHHPAASAQAAMSSLRNTPLSAKTAPPGHKPSTGANGGGPQELGGREEDAIAALVQLRSYS